MVVETGEDELSVVAVVPDVPATGGPLKDRGIEPLVDVSLIACHHGVPGLHAACTALAAAGEVEIVGCREADIGRYPGCQGGHTGDLPMVQSDLGHFAWN